MVIKSTPNKVHWNYFLALEKDLEQLSRYIEFSEGNFKTYSIELAHLLFAASSEVDVVAKLLCQYLAPDEKRENINDYRKIILRKIPEIYLSEISIPRYGLPFNPWLQWGESESPKWWRSYNHVKHERNQYFHEATLENALNSIGALLILTVHYYSYNLSNNAAPISLQKTTLQLSPESSLIKLEDSAYANLISFYKEAKN